MSERMTMRQLKDLIKDLPDEEFVEFKDPNFTGLYDDPPTADDFSVLPDGTLCIAFPFESPCEW